MRQCSSARHGIDRIENEISQNLANLACCLVTLPPINPEGMGCHSAVTIRIGSYAAIILSQE
jgi:hypothetical protein